MFAETVCKYDKGCRACSDICPHNSITFDENGKPSVNFAICDDCESFECTTICPNNSLKQCVKEYTVDDLMKVLKRDFNSWGPDGGVTFSGGDPLMHHEFLSDVLDECKSSHIHTAIETSGFAKEEHFLKILQKMNFAFIDVKNMDDEAHKWGTGVSNELILSNIEALKKSSWGGRLVLRQPTIHDYNDSTENAMKVIEFMKRLDLFEINLLKFHRLGTSKWLQLGKEYEYSDHGDMTEERMLELQDLYLSHDIACYIGDDTPF